MTNKKSTKRALLTSILAMILSASMFVGTTFAWFTDSVTSTNNIIVGGNLDVELEYSTDYEKWASVDSSTNVFAEEHWEPGRVEVVYLRIKNAGSLALRYRLNVNVASEVGSINVAGEEFKLSQHIGYGVVENVSAKFASREAAVAGVGEDSFVYLETPYAPDRQDLYPVDDTPAGAVSEVTLALVVYMSEDVGNEANHAKGAAVPTINLGINLFASQLTYEEDSFGSDYDAAADRVVANDEIVIIDNETVAGVTNNGTVNVVNGSSVGGKFENNNGNATITDSSVSNVGTVVDNNGGNLTVENTDLTQTSGTNYVVYTSKQNDENGEMTLTDVNIVSTGGGIDVRDGKTVFNSGSIQTNSTSTSGRHVFYAGNNATLIINDGNFEFNPTNLTRKGFYVCAEANSQVIINGGTFAKPSTRSSSKPSVNYKAGFYADATSSITVYGGTFGFDPTNWVADGYEAVKVGANWVVVPAGFTPAFTADEVKNALANGSNAILMADVAMDVADTGFTVAKDASAKLDLNGHDIAATSTATTGVQLFNVNGNLEIVGEGTISLTNAEYPWNTSYRYTTINVREAGVVTLGEDVEVVCNAGSGMNYAVDIYTTGKLNVNGASLHSSYIAVRCFYGDAVVNVNSGSSITSSKNNYGIWLQSAPGAQVNIAADVAYTTSDGIYYFG